MDSAEIIEIKAHIWNGWTNNYIRKEEGYRIHMFEEGQRRRGVGQTRSLCGVRIQDTGLLNLNEVEPGCYRCRRILEKRGLLPERLRTNTPKAVQP